MIRMFGISPFQIALGHDPHFSGDLLSDGEEVLGNSAALASVPFARNVEIRLAARKALLEAADERAYREAINARPCVLRRFEAKDLVYVWRKGKGSGFKAGHRGRWVGPGVVLGD